MDFSSVFDLRGKRQDGKAGPLATILLCVCAVCASALAASPAFAATVKEPIVISDPDRDASGDGWSWVASGSSGTLTLENADIQVVDTKGAEAAIVVPGGATINLKGDSFVAIAQDSPDGGNSLAAVYCDGDLTVTGDPGSSAAFKGEGSMDSGVRCAGGLTVTGPIELSVVATTVSSVGWDSVGATAVNVAGDLSIDGGASASITGSAVGLAVKGSVEIDGADSIELATRDFRSYGLSADFGGDVLISDTKNVLVKGSEMEARAPIAISGSNVNINVNASDSGIVAYQGLDIVDGSQVEVSSRGHAVFVYGELNVVDSDLHARGVGVWSTAIRVEGDVTVDNSNVSALTDVTEGTKGLSIMTSASSALAGTLTLKGSPTVVAEGAEGAIQFVSMEGDPNGVHVVLDPAIGAVEGGALRYAERTFTSPDEFTMSIWSYGTDSIGISDDFALEGASRRVVIRAERSLLHVTDNGDPVTGLEEVTATASDGTEYPAEEWLDGSHVGYYRFAKDLPAGTYSVSFGSGYETADAARLEVSEDGSSVFEMSFHSVMVEDVDHAHTWLIEPSTGERVSSLAHVLEGAQVEIGTEVDDLYRFVAYEAEGTAPEWEDGDASKAGQTIMVRGDTTITATVAEESPESPDPGSEGSGSDNPAPENPDPEKPVSDKPAPEKLNSGKSNSSRLPVTGDRAGAMLVIAVAAVGFAAVLLASRVRGQ